MICLSLFAEEYHLAQRVLERYTNSIGIVELRLDSADQDLLERALAIINRPLIFTCRPPSHGGRFSGTEAGRMTFLRRILRYRPLYVDVEKGTLAEGLLKENPKQPFILSFHDVEKTPDNLANIASSLKAGNPAMIKLAIKVKYWKDNLRILELADSLQSQGGDFTLFGTGEKGIYSRVLAPSHGSFLTYCTAMGITPTGEGQFDIEQAVDLYRLNKISASWKVYGIAGNPVKHSLSPEFHNKLFKRYGSQSVYLPFKVEDFEEFYEFALAAGIQGLSVTAPHKITSAALSEPGEERVKISGAANTLIRRGSKFVAYNTDGPAFLNVLESEVGRIDGRTVTIIGLGGAARSIAYELVGASAEVILCGRDTEKGKDLAKLLNCRFSCAPEDLASADVVINAISIARDNADTDGFLRKYIPVGAVAIDLNYYPPETYFLKEASLRGCRTINGLEMFRRQAALQFQLWTGIRPDDDAINEVLFHSSLEI